MRATSRLFGAVFITCLLVASMASAQVIGPGNSFYYSGTAVQVTNTVAASTLASVSIPAGYVTAGVHCRLIGNLSTASNAGTVTLTAAYGSGSTVPIVEPIGASTFTPPGSLSSNPFTLDVYLQQTSSASNQTLHAYMNGILGANNFPITYAGRAAQTQTSTGALNLVVTWTWGTQSTSNTVNIETVQCGIGD